MDRNVDWPAPPDADRTGDAGNLRSLVVLWALAGAEQPLTLNDVEAALGVPRTSVHRILQALVKDGWAVVGGRPKRYAPSWKVVELGFRVARRRRTRQVLVDTALDLAGQVSAPVFIGFYEHGDMVFTDYIDVRGGRAIPRLIATRFPALLTAYGRVVLAYQPRQAAELTLPPDLRRTPERRGVTGRDGLPALLQQIRERGFDINQRGRDPGIAGIAVPIFEGHNRAVAALGVRLTGQTGDQAIHLLLEPALTAARNASADLHDDPSIFP